MNVSASPYIPQKPLTQQVDCLHALTCDYQKAGMDQGKYSDVQNLYPCLFSACLLAVADCCCM